MQRVTIENAPIIEPGASEERLSAAAELLAGGGVVMLGDFLALRSTGGKLMCEVIDPTPSGHRCVYEYEVMIENAQRALQGSALGDVLPRLPQKWVVVEADGASAAES